MSPMESRSFEVLDSHKRMLDRQATREKNQATDLALSKDRLARRKRLGAEERVAQAAERLKGRNVPATIQKIESLSTWERDYYLIAEEITLNRKTVLQQFPKPRKSVRIAYFGTPAEPQEAVEAQTVELEEALN